MLFKSFRRKASKESTPQTIYYKNELAFFDSQCDFGYTTVEKNTAVVALVLDAQKEFGTPTAISVGQDGSQLAALRVASSDGGFLVFASTRSAGGERLRPGDLVLWVPFEYSKEAGDQMSDKRSGWVGLIRAKIKPEVHLEDQSFVVSCRYD
jgi:hypothetical protein